MKNIWFKLVLIFLMFILSKKIFTIFFGVYTADGFSMRPNFEDKETYFVYPDYYKKNKINYGDVVVLKFKNEKGEFIKRVVGLPNDKVEIKNGVLLLNDKKKSSEKEIEMNIFLESITPKVSYKILNIEKNSKDFNFKSFIIPKDNFFLLGDNRQNSADSRDYGVVTRDNILHKVIPKNNFIYNFIFFF